MPRRPYGEGPNRGSTPHFKRTSVSTESLFCVSVEPVNHARWLDAWGRGLVVRPFSCIAFRFESPHAVFLSTKAGDLIREEGAFCPAAVHLWQRKARPYLWSTSSQVSAENPGEPCDGKPSRTVRRALNSIGSSSPLLHPPRAP
jgi:hypothetical protein